MTEEQKPEDWMNSKWRPMAAWVYMIICMCDFVVFPVLWSLYHAILKTGSIAQWQPLSLQGAGMLHLAFGAIIGVAAFGRTQEKIAGANNGGATSGFNGSMIPSMPTPQPQVNSTYQPAPTPSTVNQPAPTPVPAAPSFGTRPSAPPRAAMPEL